MSQLTVGSLFSGIGGLDLGLERAGMRVAWQVEIDDYANQILAKHWPDVPRFRDIRTVGQHNLPWVDALVGGFPCQDISYAGAGAGLAGARSGLWWEFARLIRELGPRYVLVENVAALLTRGGGDILGTLASWGYDAEWHCLPACTVGAPHIRDRIWLVAYPHSQRCPQQYAVALAGYPRIYTGPTPTRSHHWAVEPPVGRVADGVPRRVDRLRGLGNAVVPQVAEYIGRLIVAHANQEVTA